MALRLTQPRCMVPVALLPVSASPPRRVTIACSSRRALPALVGAAREDLAQLRRLDVLGTGAKAVLAVLAGLDQGVQFVDDVVVAHRVVAHADVSCGLRDLEAGSCHARRGHNAVPTARERTADDHRPPPQQLALAARALAARGARRRRTRSSATSATRRRCSRRRSCSRVHPLGKSPVVTDGGVTVAESGAIIEYLLETYGAGRLRPAAGHARRGAASRTGCTSPRARRCRRCC